MINGSEDYFQTQLKGILAGEDAVELPLFEMSGDLVGVMKPITSSQLDSLDLIEKLTQWRNANMRSFLTQFEATPERTQNWIQNVLLKSRGQLLWLVYDQDENPIGHFGFKSLTPRSALLDNAIRGERGGHPKLFVIAGRALVQWLFQATAIERVDGIVMTDNVSAIMMNREIGFQGWKRCPLIKETVDSDTHWRIGKEGQRSVDGRYCFIVSIDRGSAVPTSSNHHAVKTSKFSRKPN